MVSSSLQGHKHAQDAQEEIYACLTPVYLKENK